MIRNDRRRFPVIIAALAGLALAVGLFTTNVPPAHAQSATITSLLARLDVKAVDGASNQIAGYIASSSQGSLSPAGFNYPAGFGRWYTVEALAVTQGKSATETPTSVAISVGGAVTSVASTGTHRAHVLPAGAVITLKMEGADWTKSYSLKSPNERTVTKCFDVDEEGNESPRDCSVGETATETYKWTSDLPPRLANDDSILVRLQYSASRPGKPGTPTVTVPTGKSGALIVEWDAPSDDTPTVRGYLVDVTRGSQLRRKRVNASTTRLPVLLLEPNAAYDVSVRALSGLAAGPWSDTVRATTNPLQGTNNPSVTLDLNDVTKVKEGDTLPLRLRVTRMANLHAGAFSSDSHHDVEFRVLGGIAEWYEFEDGGGGCGGGAFYGGGLTIGEDDEVYHDFGSLMIPDNKSAYGPMYIRLGTGCGAEPRGEVNIDTTRLCVAIADSSNDVPTGRECPSPGGSAGHAVQRITARFNDVPRSHDGESDFTFQVAFVKDVGISPTSLREDALTATGGAVTRVQRVDDRSDLFEITAEPDSDDDVTITLSADADCGEAGSICTQEENPRKLDNSPTATVAGPILTASFQGLPSQHDGETAFSFRIAFSDEIATEEAAFREHSVEVWGGEVTRAEPVDRRRDLWEVEIEPASDDAVMVSLRPTGSCAATGAVCTAGGRLLSVIPATMVPGPATWPVQVTGEAQVGKTLTADSSNLSERYGVQVTSMTYQWLANAARVPGANAQTYRPDDGKQGKKISVMATYTDDRGNEDTVTSGATDPLAARDRIRRATGLPLISGRAQVRHTLTADTSLIIDPNGLENAVFHYFWEADDESIPDATDPTYTPVEADVGKVITFIVAWVDDAGHGQNMTSQPTMPVMTEEAAAAVEFRKSIRAAANADGSLTLYWNAPDDDVTGYRILRHRHSLGEHDPLVYVADTGSTATTYTDTGVVAGVPHSYRVQAIRNAALGEKTKQIKIFPVRKASNSPATGAPAISGTAQVGETLTADISGIADEDGLENVTKDYLWAAIDSSGKIGAKYAYQWLADGAESGSGQHHAGYDNTTYTLGEDDVGKAMSVRVTFVDDAGYQETLTSAATDPVAAVPQPNSPASGAPTIDGTAQVGETLTVDTSGITDEDGLDDVTFTHRWITDDSVMVASAARSYTPTDGDRGKSVKVRVSFTDDTGNPETRTSAQTATVEARAASAGICDRTAQVRDAILHQLPDTSDCAAVTDADLGSITRLALSENGITTLKSGDFSGMSNLQHLNLADNELSALPDGIFDNLTSLQSLYLYTNRLGELPDGIFDDLTGLEDLLFFNNYIRGLPDGIFDNLTGLESLSLGGNWISELPDGVFDNLTRLYSLSLGSNDLSELPDGVFDNLTRLYSLGVGNNDLGELPDGIFDNLTGLGALTLTNIDLGELPDGIFDELTRLDTLVLSDNDLSELPDGIFDELTGLWSLKLNGNDLSELPDGVFDKLTRLRWLTLGGNELSALPEDVFDNLAKLQSLDLHNNELSELPEGVFDGLTALVGLGLRDNELSELPDGIFDNLTSLQSLNLMRNELGELPDSVFDNLTALKGLDLDENELSELPDGVFDNLTKLRTLSLFYNKLSELPDGVFDNLTALYNLNLSANELSELPDGVFDNLTALRLLYLGGNNFSELPNGVFDKLTALEFLSLWSNNLSELPDGVFDNLTALGSLWLSGNKFSELPDGVFDNLTTLRILWLFDNEFSELPDGLFQGLTNLWDLDITKNTGSPFTFVAELKQRDENTIVVEVVQGTPFDMKVTLLAEGGALSSTTVSMAAGSVSSGTVIVTPDGDDPVTISVVRAAFQLTELQVRFNVPSGIRTGLGDPLTLGEDSDTNTPATGAPTISGMAQVGETLTANTSDIADADGLAGATFIYQWLGSRDTEIQEATSATYTLVASDEGKTIKVRVTFTDDGGNEETLTSAPTAVVSAAPPPPPNNVQAVTQKSGAVELTWDAPDDATVTGYRIERGRAGENRSNQQRSVGSPKAHHTLVEDTGSADTGYTDESAEKGVEYEYRVSARNEAGTGEASGWVSAGPEEEPALGDGPPGAPRNLSATPGNKEITLSWEPPADNGNAPATRYRIEWRIDGKDYDKNHWGTSRSTTYTTNDQANLANGVTYFFRVKAENDDGNSYGPYGPASEEVSATPTSGSAVDLGTPVLSEPKNLHHGLVKLDWQDIEDAGWYVVQYYYVKGGEWLDLPAEGVDIALHGSSAVVSNLDYGIHWLRVGAASCAGESEWSQIEELIGTKVSDWEGVPVPEVAEGDEIEPCPVVLGTPVLSEPENLHHGMVRLDWQDIEDAGWYVVQYYHVEGGEWLDLPAEGVDIAFHGSSAVVSNLHGLSWLRVGAVSCAGASEWSQIEQLFGTNASDWEGVPVPEVEEGDEIEPCDEDPDTPDNSPATGAPTINGTAQVGETLTADTSGISDADGLTNVSFTYQWMADDVDINRATSPTYTLTDSEVGKAAKVRVNFIDDEGNNESLSSAATDSVSAAPQTNSPATGTPTINGTAQVGETLTANTSSIADADGLSSVQYEYQWLADGADIVGATGSTYTLVAEDEGKTVKVQVSFTDDADNEETLTSAATAAVAGAQPTEPPAKPTGLEATVTDGQVTLTWDDPGDDSITGYVILRRIPGVDPEGHFDVLVANTGTAATTYTDDTVSAETRYTYRIKAINGTGPSERSRWVHIDTPAAPVPDKPTGLEATESHGQVVLTWDDPSDDSITGYVILRRVRVNNTGGDFDVLVADTGSAANTYTDDTVAAGLTYTYRIKAINEHGTSERSRWYHIDIPEAP